MADELRSFEGLVVWQVGMELAETIYYLTKTFPRSELYVMTTQMRRSAASIPTNIAEGFGRNNRKEYLHFLGIANGSRCELLTWLHLAKRVGVAPKVEQPIELASRVGQMLTKLMRSLQE